MPKQVVYSVHQRSTSTPGLERELGQFTDDAMAEQAIDHLYRYAFADLAAGTYSLMWFDPGVRDLIVRKGKETWMVDDRNSPFPLFYKKPHDLWNQVPPSAADLKFRQEVVDAGHVEVVNSGRLF